MSPDRSAGAAAWVPRLVVSDLDGTFLSTDGTVSAVNAEAVRAAEAAGIVIMFATGRPVRWLTVVGDLAGLDPVVIASNGAVLYDLHHHQVLDSRRISVELAADAVRDIRRAVPDAAFGVETGETAGYEDGYVLTHRLDQPDVPWVSRGRVEDLVRQGEFVKLLVQHPSLSADELAAALVPIVADRLTVTHSAAVGLGLVEISAAGVSKASMLARHCERLGVAAADVAGFGDMPNDAELLAWVGRGYVMANGHPSLDGIGTRIGTNDASAVGRTILHWVDRLQQRQPDANHG